MNLSEMMTQVMAKQLESAERQYKATLDVLQREHARHIAAIKESFGVSAAEANETNNDKK
jgi:hypothetical protein